MPLDQPTMDLTKEPEDPPGYLLRSKAVKAKEHSDGNQTVPSAVTSHVDNAESLVEPGSPAEASLRGASGGHEDGVHVGNDEPSKDSVPKQDAVLSVLKHVGLVHKKAENLPDEVLALFGDTEDSESPLDQSGGSTTSPSDSTTSDNTSEEDDEQEPVEVTVNTSNQFAALLAAGSDDCNTLLEELEKKKSERQKAPPVTPPRETTPPLGGPPSGAADPQLTGATKKTNKGKSDKQVTPIPPLTELPAKGSTVLLRPTGAGRLTVENRVSLAQGLRQVTGGKAAATRFNLRRNVMAVETTSAAMTHRLLSTEKLASLPLHATLAPPRAVSIGVIRGLCPNDSTDKLTRGLESEAPVDHMRRFSGGRYAELFFGGPLPATVLIYDIEFVVEPRHVRPTQCWGCGRFGHIQSACALPTACPTCRGRHPRGKCALQLTPICPNCKCRHAAFDKGCSVYQQHKREAEAVRDTGCSWKEAGRVAAELQKRKESERRMQRAQEQAAPPPPWMHSEASRAPAWQTSALPASSVWGDTFPTLGAPSRPQAVSMPRVITPPVAPQPAPVTTREASTSTEPSTKTTELGKPPRQRVETYRRSYRPDSQQQRGRNDRRAADTRHLREYPSLNANDRPRGEREGPLPLPEQVPPSPSFPAALPGDSAGDSPRQDEMTTPPTAQEMRDMITNLERLLQTLIPLFLQNKQATAMIPEGSFLHSITSGMQRSRQGAENVYKH
ncbi:hypothetical protein HPB47_015405 [Ixodes persulcatus]|uniref:Uncharacterized protein n=1 Tax=Ixodes persulcatus TaxID=34615 RepID=A0AC60QTP3_IXOPE|nr:hypothetical protein HPB47_015405 [Ixodes persulcatus]